MCMASEGEEIEFRKTSIPTIAICILDSECCREDCPMKCYEEKNKKGNQMGKCHTIR